MRAIKFKGRRKYGYDILIGDLNCIDDKYYIFPRGEDTPLNSPDWFEVEQATIGQFTGLTDSNGNDIYEGDELIIDLDLGTNPKIKVRYSNEHAAFEAFWTVGGIKEDGEKFKHEMSSLLVNELINPNEWTTIGTLHKIIAP